MTAHEARARKLADRIQVIVAETLETRVKDPRLGFVTITDARVTGDLREATVFYTVYGDEAARADTAAALESAKGVLRTEVGRQTGVRHTPSLAFVADALPENAADRRPAASRRPRPTPRCTGPPRARRTPASRTRTRRADARPTTTTSRGRDEAPQVDERVSRGRGRPGRRRQAGRADLARRRRADPPAGRHPPGRPRRHARPDGDRRAGARHRRATRLLGHLALDRQGLPATIRLGQSTDDRRRRGRARPAAPRRPA